MKLVLIILFLAFFAAEAANYNFVGADGRKSMIKPTVLNQKEYISINRYYNIIFPGSTYDPKTYSIGHQNRIIRITPATFYLQCTIGQDNYSAQMNLPAIKYQSDILVPLESFFNALNQFPGYSAGVGDQKIVMDKFISAKKDEKLSHQSILGEDSIKNAYGDEDNKTDSVSGEFLTENDSRQRNYLSDSFVHAAAGFYDKLETISKIEKTNSSDNNQRKIEILPENPELRKIETEMSYPPNLYVIPKSLIRRELQEIKSKNNN
jgi:hypothetical protein